MKKRNLYIVAGVIVAVVVIAVVVLDSFLRKPPPAKSAIEIDRFELVVDVEPIRLENMRDGWGASGIRLIRENDGTLVAAWIVRPPSEMREQKVFPRVNYAGRVKGKWTSAQRLTPERGYARLEALSTGKAGTVAVFTYDEYAAYEKRMKRINILPEEGVFIPDRCAFSVWKNSAWGEPTVTPSPRSFVRAFSGKDGKLHFFWFDEVPGAFPFVSANFTHDVLFHCSYDGVFSSNREVVNIGKHYDFSGNICVLLAGNGNTIDVVTVNTPAYGKPGGAERIVVVNYDPVSGKSDYKRVATDVFEYSADERSACNIGPDGAYIFWPGSAKKGDELYALKAVSRTGGKWGKPEIVTDLGKDGFVYPIPVPVTIGGEKFACVFYRHDGKRWYILGKAGFWSKPQDITLPCRVRSAVEVSPGVIGVVGFQDDNPTYIELKITEKM